MSADEGQSINAMLGASLINADETVKPARSRYFCDRDFYTGCLGLINAMLGAAVLAYPFAFLSAGIVGALVCVCILGPLSSAGVAVLLRSMRIASATDPSVRSFGGLVGAAFGPRLAGAVDALIVVYSFGTCIGYLILLGDVITPLVESAHPAWENAQPVMGQDPVWRLVLCASAVVCLLLSTLRTISALRYAAIAGVLATVFIVVMLVVQAAQSPCRLGRCDDECGRNGWCTEEQADESADGVCNGERGVSLWPLSASALLRSLPLFAFALQCHIQSSIVFTELPARLRTDGAATTIAASSTALMVFLDVAVGLAGFTRFGAQTQGDVLKNFGPADGLADAARACLACAALSSFPLQHFPARLALHGLVKRCRGGRAGAGGEAEAEAAAAEGPSRLFVVTEASVWVAVTLGFAQLVGSALAPVFQLVGAVCGSSVIFTLPGAIWLRLGPRDSASRPLVGGLLVGCGLFILATGTTVTILQIVEGSGKELECKAS